MSGSFQQGERMMFFLRMIKCRKAVENRLKSFPSNESHANRPNNTPMDTEMNNEDGFRAKMDAGMDAGMVMDKDGSFQARREMGKDDDDSFQARRDEKMQRIQIGHERMDEEDTNRTRNTQMITHRMETENDCSQTSEDSGGNAVHDKNPKRMQDIEQRSLPFLEKMKQIHWEEKFGIRDADSETIVNEKKSPMEYYLEHFLNHQKEINDDLRKLTFCLVKKINENRDQLLQRHQLSVMPLKSKDKQLLQQQKEQEVKISNSEIQKLLKLLQLDDKRFLWCDWLPNKKIEEQQEAIEAYWDLVTKRPLDWFDEKQEGKSIQEKEYKVGFKEIYPMEDEDTHWIYQAFLQCLSKYHLDQRIMDIQKDSKRSFEFSLDYTLWRGCAASFAFNQINQWYRTKNNLPSMELMKLDFPDIRDSIFPRIDQKFCTMDSFIKECKYHMPGWSFERLDFVNNLQFRKKLIEKLKHHFEKSSMPVIVLKNHQFFCIHDVKIEEILFQEEQEEKLATFEEIGLYRTNLHTHYAKFPYYDENGNPCIVSEQEESEDLSIALEQQAQEHIRGWPHEFIDQGLIPYKDWLLLKLGKLSQTDYLQITNPLALQNCKENSEFNAKLEEFRKFLFFSRYWHYKQDYPILDPKDLVQYNQNKLEMFYKKRYSKAIYREIFIEFGNHPLLRFDKEEYFAELRFNLADIIPYFQHDILYVWPKRTVIQAITILKHWKERTTENISFDPITNRLCIGNSLSMHWKFEKAKNKPESKRQMIDDVPELLKFLKIQDLTLQKRNMLKDLYFKGLYDPENSDLHENFLKWFTKGSLTSFSNPEYLTLLSRFVSAKFLGGPFRYTLAEKSTREIIQIWQNLYANVSLKKAKKLKTQFVTYPIVASSEMFKIHQIIQKKFGNDLQSQRIKKLLAYSWRKSKDGSFSVMQSLENSSASKEIPEPEIKLLKATPIVPKKSNLSPIREWNMFWKLHLNTKRIIITEGNQWIDKFPLIGEVFINPVDVLRPDWKSSFVLENYHEYHRLKDLKLSSVLRLCPEEKKKRQKLQQKNLPSKPINLIPEYIEPPPLRRPKRISQSPQNIYELLFDPWIYDPEGGIEKYLSNPSNDLIHTGSLTKCNRSISSQLLSVPNTPANQQAIQDHQDECQHLRRRVEKFHFPRDDIIGISAKNPKEKPKLHFIIRMWMKRYLLSQNNQDLQGLKSAFIQFTGKDPVPRERIIPFIKTQLNDEETLRQQWLTKQVLIQKPEYTSEISLDSFLAPKHHFQESDVPKDFTSIFPGKSQVSHSEFLRKFRLFLPPPNQPQDLIMIQAIQRVLTEKQPITTTLDVLIHPKTSLMNRLKTFLSLARKRKGQKQFTTDTQTQTVHLFLSSFEPSKDCVWIDFELFLQPTSQIQANGAQLPFLYHPGLPLHPQRFHESAPIQPTKSTGQCPRSKDRNLLEDNTLCRPPTESKTATASLFQTSHVTGSADSFDRVSGQPSHAYAAPTNPQHPHAYLDHGAAHQQHWQQQRNCVCSLGFLFLELHLAHN